MPYNVNQLPSGLQDEIIDVEAEDIPEAKPVDVSIPVGIGLGFIGYLLIPAIPIYFVIRLWNLLTTGRILNP